MCIFHLPPILLLFTFIFTYYSKFYPVIIFLLMFPFFPFIYFPLCISFSAPFIFIFWGGEVVRSILLVILSVFVVIFPSPFILYFHSFMFNPSPSIFISLNFLLPLIFLWQHFFSLEGFLHSLTPFLQYIFCFLHFYVSFSFFLPVFLPFPF